MNVQKRILIGFLLTSIVMSASACSIAPTNELNSSDEVIAVIAPSSSEPEPIPEPVTVNLLAVGDNLIHDGIYKQAQDRTTDGSYDFSFAYENIADKIQQADVSIINQETIVSTEHAPSSYPMFNSPTALGEEMIEIGFDIFNLANNHVLDKGEKGLLSAIDFWSGKKVVTTGAYKNEEAFGVIPTQIVNDITFSYIGVTELTNGLSLPQGSEIVLLLGENEDQLKERIEKAQTISDIVVVNIHWGNEYTHTPTDRQKYLAQKMGEWGADIIIGHHPHVIQPVEYIENIDGSKTLVIYSLGNFISAQNRGARMIGGMMEIAVTKNYEKETVTVEGAKFSPVVTHYDGGFKDIRVYPFEQYTQELANKHGVRKYSPEFNYQYIIDTVNQVIDQQFLAQDWKDKYTNEEEL